MKKSSNPISLMSYDDIFQTDAPDDKREQVQEISLAELHTYKDHPFRVIDDDAMQKTAESIQQYEKPNEPPSALSQKSMMLLSHKMPQYTKTPLYSASLVRL